MRTANTLIFEDKTFRYHTHPYLSVYAFFVLNNSGLPAWKTIEVYGTINTNIYIFDYISFQIQIYLELWGNRMGLVGN